MKTNESQIKNLFVNNFSLTSRLYDMNVATLKVNASFEYEGEFSEPELILNAYDNVINEEEIKNMLEMFGYDDFEEVTFKKENNDYIITAGCSEAVYVLKLQILRVA